jgi:hypothetical protein
MTPPADSAPVAAKTIQVQASSYSGILTALLLREYGLDVALFLSPDFGRLAPQVTDQQQVWDPRPSWIPGLAESGAMTYLLKGLSLLKKDRFALHPDLPFQWCFREARLRTTDSARDIDKKQSYYAEVWQSLQEITPAADGFHTSILETLRGQIKESILPVEKGKTPKFKARLEATVRKQVESQRVAGPKTGGVKALSEYSDSDRASKIRPLLKIWDRGGNFESFRSNPALWRFEFAHSALMLQGVRYFETELLEEAKKRGIQILDVAPSSFDFSEADETVKPTHPESFWWTVALTLNREALPPGATRVLQWTEEGAPPLVIEWVESENRELEESGFWVVFLRTLVPVSVLKEKDRTSILFTWSERMVRKLHSLFPFSEFHLSRMAPDIRDQEKFEKDIETLLPALIEGTWQDIPAALLMEKTGAKDESLAIGRSLELWSPLFRSLEIAIPYWHQTQAGIKKFWELP